MLAGTYTIHEFLTRLLDSFFDNVCELDLVFNFYKGCKLPQNHPRLL